MLGKENVCTYCENPTLDYDQGVTDEFDRHRLILNICQTLRTAEAKEEVSSYHPISEMFAIIVGNLLLIIAEV